MKTAVEWLQSQIVFESFDEELLARWDEDSDLSEYFEQALQMEKEQIIAFAKKCIHKALELDILMAYNQVEQYYNETFNQQEQ